MQDDELLDVVQEYVNDAIIDSPNLQLPSPALKTFYRNEAERKIWFEGSVGFEALNATKKILMYNSLDRNIPTEERKPIKIYIDSTGGDVEAMWQLIQVIKLSKTPVWTINVCEAFSAACIILLAGHKRFALPNAACLLHSGSCTFSGDAEKVESSKKFFDKLNKKIDEFTVVNTKIADVKTLKKKGVSDWWMDADEMLANGIIDKIVDDIDEII